jgi:hypothetical protein
LKKNCLYLLILLILLAGIVANVYYAKNLPLEVYNVIPAVVLYDIVEEGNYFLTGWYLPSYNYIFTEYFSYFLLRVFLNPGALMIKLGSLMTALLTPLFLFFILRKYFQTNAAIFGLAAFFAVPQHHLLWPTYHNAVIASSLLALMLLLRALREGGGSETRRPFVIYSSMLFIVTLLTSFSDSLFVVIFAVPAFLATFSFEAIYRRKLLPLKRKAALFTLIILGVVLGTLMQDLAIYIGINMKIVATGPIVKLRDIPSELYRFVDNFLAMFNMDIFHRDSLSSALLRAINLAVFTALAIKALNTLRQARGSFNALILMFLIAMAVTLCSAYVFNMTKRLYYLTMLYTAYSVFMGVALNDSVKKGGKALSTAFIVLFTVSSAGNIYGTFNDYLTKDEHPLKVEYRELSELARLLEENDLSYGYASFSNAHLVTFISDNKIRVRAVSFQNNIIEPFLWYCNFNWYLPSYHSGPTFLILEEGDKRDGFGKIEPLLIKQMFGDPVEVLESDGIKVFVWDHNIIQNYWSILDLGEKMKK